MDFEKMAKVEEVYQKNKLQFLDILMRRFLDKSSYCRSKVIKVFSKLTEENMVPSFMYMELFTAVLGRLNDQTVNVRKYALKLLQQLVYTFAVIFEVKRGEGEKFPPQEQVLEDYEKAEKNFLKVKDEHDMLEIEFNQRKQQIMLEHPDAEPAQLQMIVGRD